MSEIDFDGQRLMLALVKAVRDVNHDDIETIFAALNEHENFGQILIYLVRLVVYLTRVDDATLRELHDHLDREEMKAANQ
jgi:hypothetical protein